MRDSLAIALDRSERKALRTLAAKAEPPTVAIFLNREIRDAHGNELDRSTSIAVNSPAPLWFMFSTATTARLEITLRNGNVETWTRTHE